MESRLPVAGGFIPLATTDDDTLLPSPTELPTTAPKSPAAGPGKLTRLNGVALVISLQIGSGIFTVPSFVASNVANPGWGVAVWFLGGLLVWTGAASFIELGLRIPHNGGILEYMRRCYGNPAGFLFTWAWVLMAKPATNAIIATIFADYITRPFVAAPPAPSWLLKIVGLFCIWGIAFVNGRGATAGASVANKFLVLKLSAVSIIAVVGVVYFVSGTGAGVPESPSGWFGDMVDQPPVDAWTWIGGFGTALFGVLYCYGGWETVGFVLGDMKDPEGDLSAVVNGSMTAVIIGFVLLNAALYTCLPMDLMRASRTVSVEFARQTLGAWGGVLLSVMVSISAMGALNANTFATAKLAVTAAEVGYFPDVLANAHCSSVRDEPQHIDAALSWAPRWLVAPAQWCAAATRRLRWQDHVPILPLFLNAAMTTVYLFTGSFGGLVTFIGVTEYIFFFASVIGLLLLRRRDALRTSPVTYRTWTGNPIIFSVVSVLLILRTVISEPIIGVAIVCAGAVGLAQFWWRFRRGGLAPVAVH